MAQENTSWIRRPIWLWIAALAGVGQFLASGRVSTEGLQDIAGVGQNPPISPANYAFAIWGVILVLFLVITVWALIDRSTRPIMLQLAPRLSLVALGYWLWLESALRNQMFLGLIIFLVMIFTLISALRVLQRNEAELEQWPTLLRWSTYSGIGVYLGWTSAAVWLNVAAWVTQWGWPTDGTWGTTWQVLILAAAAGASVLLMFVSRGLRSVYFAQMWAYVAIVINTFDVNLAFVIATTLAILVITGTWITARGGFRELRM